jgi:3-deoxy-7-phosphoheptulonate synthase
MNLESNAIRSRAAQQPSWDSDEVCAELRTRPPLVAADACHALRRDLELVANGFAFVVQGGECAERFADAVPYRIQSKAAQLEHLADRFEELTGLSAVRVGRFAGQYAKPRSSPTETLPDGSSLPVYRGDAVNDLSPTVRARRAEPRRLLLAYDNAAVCLDALFLNQCLPAETHSPTYVSHEALLLDFEDALTRPDARGSGEYGSSAHFLWVGDRTRQPDGAHVEFLARVANPVGVKVGPTTRPEELAAIVDLLLDGHPAGRLTLIARMGAGVGPERLPPLLTALGDRASRVAWLCDPLHGNTRRNRAGQKTRVLTDVFAEVTECFEALSSHGLWFGGLHLETTADPVTECVWTARDLNGPLPRYESACDPRLNAEQAEAVVALAAELVFRRTRR